MAKVFFSDVGIRSLPIPEKGQRSYWDPKLPSFGIRVSQAGSRTFVLNKNNSLITIGRYGIINLSEARAEAKRLLAEFTLGRVRPQSITYPKAVELFLQDKAKNRRSRTVADYKRLLNRLGFKGQLSDITHTDVARRFARFAAPSEHSHRLVAAKVFWNWCEKRRYVEHNPTAGLSKSPSPPRSRVLSDAELKSIWVSTYSADNFSRIVRLLILTGMRRGECAGLRAENVDLTNNLICLKPEQTKNGREHTFPVSELTSTILTNLATSQYGYLFPARGKNSPFNGWGKCKQALDDRSGLSGYTLHDLRRSYAVNLQKLGVRLEVIEKLLGHISGSFAGIVGVYQRYDFMPEMREAVQKWEARLLSLVG